MSHRWFLRMAQRGRGGGRRDHGGMWMALLLALLGLLRLHLFQSHVAATSSALDHDPAVAIPNLFRLSWLVLHSSHRVLPLLLHHLLSRPVSPHPSLHRPSSLYLYSPHRPFYRHRGRGSVIASAAACVRWCCRKLALVTGTVIGARWRLGRVWVSRAGFRGRRGPGACGSTWWGWC